jgi:hypothetical protein
MAQVLGFIQSCLQTLLLRFGGVLLLCSIAKVGVHECCSHLLATPQQTSCRVASGTVACRLGSVLGHKLLCQRHTGNISFLLDPLMCQLGSGTIVFLHACFPHMHPETCIGVGKLQCLRFRMALAVSGMSLYLQCNSSWRCTYVLYLVLFAI